MANPVSSRAHDVSNNNILTTLQASKGDGVRNDEFSRALESSVRNQERPVASRQEQTPPREVSHGENRGQADNSEPVRRNHAESSAAEKTERPADANKPVDAESSGSKPAAAAQNTTPAEDASTAELASATEETKAETVPANLAVVASIIAALEKTAKGVVSESVAPDAEADLLGSTRRSAGSILSGLLEAAGGKAGDATRDLAAKDAASALATDAKQAKADASSISSNFSRVLATISQPQSYSAQAATALQTLTAEPPATPGAMPNTVVPGLRTEQSGIPQLQIHTPTGQRVWAEEVGSRLMFMVGRGESRAELVLTPPSLGKLGVSIQVNGDQTTAHFVASSAAAREALEHALPRLREALQQAGINLGQTDVSTSNERHTGPNGNQDGRGQSSSHTRGNPAMGDEMTLPLPQNWIRIESGRIDTFA